MKLIEKTPKSLSCIIGGCPAVFETDRNTYIVIGKQLTDAQVLSLLKGRIGEDEAAIEFPQHLLGNVVSDKH